MSFQPLVPVGGLAGWRFLNRTLETQQDSYQNNTVLERETSRFQERFAAIKSAEDLVGDFEVLKVALGAFGLDDDINNKFFIQKVLEDGTSDPSALANKLSDPRYKQFADAFGFGPLQVPGYLKSDFAEDIVAKYKERQFETDIGKQNEEMRLALNLRREIATIANDDRTADSMWFGVMGQPPVRKVFEQALGLPSSIGTLDLDLQLRTFRERAEDLLGSSEISQFSEPENVEALLQQFFARSTATTSFQQTSSAAIALTILQSA